ncbi:MAG: bifunctional folylpolyglutamate synthase/dihydrofolate synthase [Chloroflexi bacterium]|nr:bifunctional folylpolyglutamate synthase/dihydrofolate synthase [Chloroflexota bacterium]
MLEWLWSFSARKRSAHEMAVQRAVKLERMYALLAVLGHPESRFPSLLVAGTKGKGSTVAMLSACLRAAGYRTGRYTSPHLVNWRERTTIDAQPISADEVLGLAGPVRHAVESLPNSLGAPTTFEVGTALTFEYFARQSVDVAVVEVGTGGRFDATNLVDTQVAVMAPVSYDHTQTLGSTLTSIGWHKAGIMRVGRPAVAAPQSSEALSVIEGEARLLRVPLRVVGRDWTWSAAQTGIRVAGPDVALEGLEVGLIGDHQLDNATTAIAALDAVRQRFPVQTSDVVSALKTVEWPGRLQIVSRQPLVVLDGAHNAASAEVVRRALDANFTFDRLLLVVGLSTGKDALGVLGALTPRADRVYLTRSRHERSAPPDDLAPLVLSAAPRASISIVPDAPSALDLAVREAGPRDAVLVTGSLFLVGEALEWWRRSRR